MPPRTGAQRAGDLGKGLAAIFTLVAIVAGVPMGLYRFAGQWMPKTVPTLDQAREALSRPVSDDAMLTGLTLVGWVLWALFTLAVTVEIISWIGQAASPSTRRQSVTPGRAHGKRVRLAVPGLQNAAASLVMAALLVLPTAGAASASSSPASPAPMALQMPDQVAAPPTSPGPAPAAAPAAPQASERVTVKRGDSPWGIAERHLGEGERWRELRHEDGRALASREIIHPGQILLVPAAPAPADTPVAVAAASAETVDPATTVVVRPGDSLWEIAEDKLGDGEQYQGIWTANRGRVMEDGARFGDPDVIHPGWKLSVPGQRYSPPASATTPPAPAPPAATPATPPPAPPVAAAPTSPAAQDTDSVASTGAQAPADSVAAPPATIWPPPATTARPPSTAAAPPPTWQPPVTTGLAPPDAAAPPAAAEPPAPATATTKESSGRDAPLPVGLVSGSLAAAAVVGLISRRRHRQIGLRRPGRRPPLPTGEAAQAETALSVGADPEGAALLDDALAAVAVAVNVDGAGLPEILGAHLTGDRVELLLASSFDEVAPPFQASADGLRWGASAADVVGFVAPADRPCSPAPTMVTLGATEDGTLMINLERIGLLGLEGNPDRAAGVLRRMAFELGAPFLNAIVHVVLVGLPEVSGLEDHVETASSLGEALDRASALRGWSDEQLTAYQVGSADVARAAGLNADTWAPSVVLAAGPFTDEELQRAAELTADPSRTGMAVVVASDRTAARWALGLDDDLVDVGPLGLAVDPHDDSGQAVTATVPGYGPEEAEAVSSVLATAARTDDVSTDEPPYDTLDEWAWPAPAGDEQDDPAGRGNVRAEEGDELVGLHVVPDTKDPEPTFDVCIKILGPIEVEGNISGGKPRAKSKELVAALALHRDGLTTAQIESILWPAPQSGPARSTLHSTVSAARAWLRRVEGENLIPNTAVNGGESRYRLSPCVGPNWDRFQWLTRNATGVDAAERLTEALAMVRGEPVGAGGWAWALPHVTEMRCAIADAAHRLAQLRLETKDLPRARAAARAGLQGSPWDQLLYGDLMEASSKGGDPEGVDEARRELVARLGGEDHEIRPEVEAIYQRCRKQHAT